MKVKELNMQMQAGNSNFQIHITQCILKYEITVISSFRKMYTNFVDQFWIVSFILLFKNC